MSSEGTGYRRVSAHWRAGMSEPPLEFQQCRILLLQSLLKAVGCHKVLAHVVWQRRLGNSHRLELRECPTAHKQQLPLPTQANKTPPRFSPSDMTKTAVVLRVCWESCCNPERKAVHLGPWCIPTSHNPIYAVGRVEKNNLPGSSVNTPKYSTLRWVRIPNHFLGAVASILNSTA